MSDLWFVTGGARSGKSNFSEQLAFDTGRPVVYIATMQPLDEEMRRRISRHRSQRPRSWGTIEAPLDLTAALNAINPNACVILDCLSLWVSNRLLAAADIDSAEVPETIEPEIESDLEILLTTTGSRIGETILVSNEVGSGLVPEYPLGRAYRDLLGRTNQYVGKRASRAWLLVAGRTLELPANDP